jgi:hypothetical protein
VDRVDLYRAPTTVADADAIGDWLGDRIDAPVVVRDRFLDVHRSDDDPDLATAFAGARVLSPRDRETGNTMLGVVRYEERALDDPDREGGVLYDGHAVQRACNAALPPAERGLDRAHVVLFDRAIGTWRDHDGRWHKRVCVLGQPATVSVPGLYEAPAKPEAYYRAKQSAALTGGAPPREVLESGVDGDFLVVDDPRTTAALKGYVLAAVDYLDTGEGFCDDPTCRLSNPHRQAGVVEAQLREPAFCDAHAAKYG